MKVESNRATTISASRDESLARAILQLNPKSARAKRVVALVTIGIPAIGFAIALYLVFTGRATALDYTLFVVFYAIQMFGITIGFHRYVAHKQFKTSRFFEGVLMIAGSMALEGPLLFWVSTHRRHHRFADEPGDPHSPNLGGPGLSGKLKGLWYAHIPWMFSDQESRPTVFARDVLRDRHLYSYNRTYAVWALVSLLLPGSSASGSVAPWQLRSRASSSAGWRGFLSPTRPPGASGQSVIWSVRGLSLPGITAPTTGRSLSSPSARACRTTITRSPAPIGTDYAGGNPISVVGSLLCWRKLGLCGICACRTAARSTVDSDETPSLLRHLWHQQTGRLKPCSGGRELPPSRPTDPRGVAGLVGRRVGAQGEDRRI